MLNGFGTDDIVAGGLTMAEGPFAEVGFRRLVAYLRRNPLRVGDNQAYAAAIRRVSQCAVAAREGNSESTSLLSNVRDHASLVNQTGDENNHLIG